MFPLGTDRTLTRPTVVNHALLLACGLVFIAQLLLQMNATTPRGLEGFMSIMALDPGNPTIHAFFTYQFVHGGFLHLIGNMLFLWVFGPNVEDRLGRIGYGVFFLLGGAAAGAAHILFESAPVIGASGSIAAVTGAYLVLFPRTHIRVLLMFIIIGVFNIPAVWFIGFAIAKDLFLQGFGGNDGVARLAHLGGYFFGAGVSITLLATGLLQREAFDMFSLSRQAQRRRSFRSMTTRGADPWNAAGRTPPRPTARQEKLNAKEQARVQERARISAALGEGRVDDAANLYLDMLQKDPDATLAPGAQRDIANQLFAMGEHRRAAEAYERHFQKHDNSPDAPSIGLMLALLQTRYLDEPNKARSVLRDVRDRLSKPDERQMAESLLAEIEGQIPGGAQA